MMQCFPGFFFFLSVITAFAIAIMFLQYLNLLPRTVWNNGKSEKIGQFRCHGHHFEKLNLANSAVKNG